jgi:ubiquitin C-terminal hydrolase
LDEEESSKDACDSPNEEAKVSQEDSGNEDDSCTWSNTLAPRNSVCDSSNEPSVSACLKQFTAIELLTGNNKVGCETCTKRAGKSTNGKEISQNCVEFSK